MRNGYCISWYLQKIQSILLSTQANPLPSYRSCMKQKCERKNTQQDGVLVSFDIEIRLNKKDGTQRTSVRSNDVVTWTVPMCVAKAFSPLGRWMYVLIEDVIKVNLLKECTIWSVASVSKIEVLWLKRVLFTCWTEKIECLGVVWEKDEMLDMKCEMAETA